MKKIFIIFSALLLLYMLWPQPASIEDFQALPNSEKSTLSGDTWQIPNISGFFSNNYRDFAVSFYSKTFQGSSHFFFPPIRINYPPEFAYTAVKQYTESTYLEELVYPLKDSLYVNGFEPFYQDGKPKFWGSTKFAPTGKPWYTKVTVRFYPSSIWIRFLIWLGIVVSIARIYQMTRKIIA